MSRTRPVMRRISQTATRPPSAPGTSRWEITPFTVPALLLGQFAHDDGKRELLDRADPVGDRAADHRGGLALLEGVDAEARDTLDFVREVDLVLVGVFVELVLVGEQVAQRLFCVGAL